MRSSIAVRSGICGSGPASGGRLFLAIRRLPVAIKAYYTEVNPVSGRALFALNRDDYEKIRQGYGCPNCLEDYQGMYLPTCPLCKHSTDFSDHDFLPVIPTWMAPSDPSLLDEPAESDYFDSVRSASA